MFCDQDELNWISYILGFLKPSKWTTKSWKATTYWFKP